MAELGLDLRENGKKGKKLNGFLGKMTKNFNPPLKDRRKDKASDSQRLSAVGGQNVTKSCPNCEFSATASLLSVDNST